MRRNSQEERRDIRRDSLEVRRVVARAQERRDVRRSYLRREDNEMRESRRRQNEQIRSVEVNERRIQDVMLKIDGGLKKGDPLPRKEGLVK